MRTAARIFLLGVLLLADRAGADSLSLPLEGFYHPGRAMPVRWNLSAVAGGTINLSADRAISSRVIIGDSLQGVFPFLALDPAVRNLQWRMPAANGDSFPTPLRGLEESERLVGIAAADNLPPLDIFPGHPTTVIHLDPNHPIEGPAMAWESLDALVLDGKSYGQLSLAQRQELVVEGVALAVAGNSAPDKSFIWRQSGGLWIADGGLAVPDVVNPDALAPIRGWTAGRSAQFRGRIVLLGIIFCLMASGVSLWRWRWTSVAMIALSVAASAAFAWDNQHRSPIAEIQGDVSYDPGGVPTTDHWTGFSSHRDADLVAPLLGVSRPIVGDAEQFEQSNLELICDGKGDAMALSAKLPADVLLVTLSRTTAPTTNPWETTPLLPTFHRIVPKAIFPVLSGGG